MKKRAQQKLDQVQLAKKQARLLFGHKPTKVKPSKKIYSRKNRKLPLPFSLPPLPFTTDFPFNTIWHEVEGRE